MHTTLSSLYISKSLKPRSSLESRSQRSFRGWHENTAEAQGRQVVRCQGVWPQREGDNYNQWRQSTNPVTEVVSVEGYEAVDVKFTDINWGGLENGALHGGSTPSAILDGDVDSVNWCFAVGSRVEWSGGIPGPCDGGVSGSEPEVELYAKCLPGAVQRCCCRFLTHVLTACCPCALFSASLCYLVLSPISHPYETSHAAVPS